MYRPRLVLALSTPSERKRREVAICVFRLEKDMRTLAFDGCMDVSGDMILTALLDAGADPPLSSSP
ncbi:MULTISPECIES: hypothetical protein [Natrinema]|uniref:hypothetical protein n=1 Tax=Natrinema TaxID=88723 RepID=UPI0011AEBB5C|nr:MULTISPECIES: hypothetical protein [Natrinema]